MAGGVADACDGTAVDGDVLAGAGSISSALGDAARREGRLSRRTTATIAAVAIASSKNATTIPMIAVVVILMLPASGCTSGVPCWDASGVRAGGSQLVPSPTGTQVQRAP